MCVLLKQPPRFLCVAVRTVGMSGGASEQFVHETQIRIRLYLYELVCMALV